MRRFVLIFSLAGIVPGLVALLAGEAAAGLPLGWRALCVVGLSWLTFVLVAAFVVLRDQLLRREGQARVATRVASGDLTLTPTAAEDPSGDLRRLIVSLRRAVSQVQRVTQNLRETSRDTADTSRQLLEFARRQGSAVERTLAAVGHMGTSLTSAGERVAVLYTFSRDAGASLAEMTERMESVGEVLATLNDFVTRQSLAVAEMTDRIQAIATSGGELAKFAVEADLFVGAVASGQSRAGRGAALGRPATWPAR